MNENELADELFRLFQTAKKVDEFEFVNVLIGFNGMGDQRALTHLYESRAFIKDIKALIEANQNKHSKTRLALLLYGHIFEMDELYNILGNLLRISSGQGLKYVPDLYNRQNKEELTPTEKFSELSQLAEQCHFRELVNGINELYLNRVRNAFFHSAYSLIEDDFCIVKGRGIKIGHSLHNVLSIDDFLIPKINSAITFIENFFDCIDKNKLSYRENKLVQGRLPNLQPVVILGDTIKGLIGFQSLVGSWVKISNSYGTENFVEAMNIRFSFEPKEITELTKRLLSYEEEKTPVGKDFKELETEILQTKDQGLIRNLATVYYNWANNTAKIAEEKSGLEKNNLFFLALQRYDLSIHVDSTFSRVHHNKGITKLRFAQFKNTLDNNIRWEVVGDIKNALLYEPLMYEAHLNLGKILYEIAFEEPDTDKKTSLLHESIEKHSQAIDIYPKDDISFQSRGKSFWKIAQTCKEEKNKYFLCAIQDYEVAIKLKPKLDYYLSLSTLYGDFAEVDKDQSNSLYEKAIQLLEEAQKNYAENSDVRFRMGNKYMMLTHSTNDKNYLNLALNAFKDAVQLDKQNVNAWNNYGHCLFHIALKEDDPNGAIKLFEEAITKLNEALALEPNHDTAYYNLGTIYIEIWRRTNTEEKEKLLGKAITNLSHGEALSEGLCGYHLARAFAIKGETEKFVYWLDKYLSDNVVERESIIEERDFESQFAKPEFEKLLSTYFDKQLV
jgi:tetratricopeptide (TPR) repeat protein